MGSTMWMIELATNTITAESRIGSHKAVMGTIVPPGEPPLGSRKYLSGTRKSYAWAAERVKPAGDQAHARGIPTATNYTVSVGPDLRSRLFFHRSQE